MLTLDGVGRTVRGRTLFQGITWTIHPGDRVGLVGPNGCGKTSLLRIVAGIDEPDEGRVSRSAGLRIAYLPQEVETEVGSDAPLIEAALAGAGEIRELGDECHRLADEMAAAAADPADAERLARLSDVYGERRALFEWFGGDQLEARAKAVLGGLGFGPDDFDRPVRTFSGGWRMRAVMARLLLSGADLLLLDEPTNHLDLDALQWLETTLSQSPAAIVVVSHDRVFLDRVVKRVADLLRSRVRFTPGGYTAWAKAREEERRLVERRDEQLKRDEARLDEFVERFRYKATKAAAAQDKLRLLEDVRAERARLQADHQRSWSFRWPDPPPTHEVLMRLDGATKRYGEHVVLDGVSLEVRRGQRVALMGPNGAGKTTLLRLLSGELRPEAGRRETAPGLLVGVFAQHQLEALDPAATVFEEASRGAYGRLPEDVRRALGTLGLSDLHIDRAVRTLSGGERARLALARLLLRPASLLLLDEPTNHLDLPLREGLEEALAAWPGTLVVVSHDRAFLDKLTTTTLAVQDGAVEAIDGGWQGWLAWRAAKAALAAGKTVDGPANERSREGRRARAEALQERSRRLRPLRERVRLLESEVERAETRLGEVDALLGDPNVHSDGVRMRDLARERESLDGDLARLYAEWEDAAAALAEAENDAS